MELKKQKNTNNCEIRVTVTCDETEWSAAQEKAFENIAKNVTVKGFRKGKAPLPYARRVVSKSEILNKAADKLVDAAYKQMFDDPEIKPVLQPKLEVKEFSEKSLTFDFIVVTAPVVELGDYKGLSIEKKAVKVTKKDVENELKDMLAKNAELEVVDENTPAEKGMTAVIDFVGYVDGKAFDGGEAANFDLELGSNTFVPGFEDQLIGVKAGETKDVVITFPENYVADLSGKEATFKVTVNELKKKVYPEANEDFVKEANIDGVTTLEELQAHLKQQLTERKTKEEEKRQVNALIAEVIKNASFTIHPDLLALDAENIVKDFKDRITAQGFDIDDYYKMTNTTAETIKEQAMNEALSNAKRIYVLNQIGINENITVNENDVNTKLEELSSQYNASVEDLKKQLGDRLSDFAANLRNDKIVAFLKENNQFITKSKSSEEKKDTGTEVKKTPRKSTKKATVSEDK